MRLQLTIRSNKIEIGKYTIAATAIIALSSLLRLFFIAHNWPEVNSDEGTVGLMALHIEHFKDFPVYFYSQGVMGSLEAYVGALLFPIFGTTVFALRFGLLLLFIPFLITMYRLTGLLYSKKLALLTLVLLSLGASDTLGREYAAFAGHAETPLFCALLVLVAAQTAFSSPSAESLAKWPWRRMLFYGVWGWLVGVALWNDPLAIPFVATTGVFLFLFCRHELRYPTLLSILLGLLIGAFPMIMYSISTSIAQGSLSVFGYLVSYGHPVASDSLFERFAAAFLVTLPVSTGGATFCAVTPANAWPLRMQMLPCTVIHGTWALVMVIVWLVAVIMAVRVLRPLMSAFAIDAVSPEERRMALLQGARLVLLVSAFLAFLIFAVSVQAITDPWANHRYLIALGVATPAVLWPLWSVFGSLHFRHRSLLSVVRVLSVVVLGCFIVTLGTGTLLTIRLFPQVEQYTQWRTGLAPALVHMHIRHIYTDYWTCDATAFFSQEQVECSVLDAHLQTGINRYVPYVSIVAQDRQAAYVFQVGSAQANLLARRMAQNVSGQQYRITYVDGYVIYQPVSH